MGWLYLQKFLLNYDQDTKKMKLNILQMLTKGPYILVLALVVSLLATGLSLIYETRINSEGFFSLYQGPAYLTYGWPWGFWKCYDIISDPYGEQGCSIAAKLLLLDILSWFLISTFFLLIRWVLIKSILLFRTRR